MTSTVLVLNAGSSSIKFSVYGPDQALVLGGMADGIGVTPVLKVNDEKAPASFASHSEALDAILSALADHGYPLARFDAAAHRVVHGGTKITAPARITPEVRDLIAACIPLAPLHNPHNLAAIDTLTERAPDLPQFASFDTAFHASNAEVAKRYAVSDDLDALGIRRYGFHGSSYAALVRRMPEVTGQALPDRVLAFHLGNGASVCAIRNGKSVATSMGYSPVSGLTMGTRSGDIDANAVLRLVEELGLDATRKALNNSGGLWGLCGSSDMREILSSDSEQTRLAAAHFCHWAARQAGNLMMALGGVDAIVFTGGIGENAPAIRMGILDYFNWCGTIVDQSANDANQTQLHAAESAVTIWRIEADEERQILMDALEHLTPQSGWSEQNS